MRSAIRHRVGEVRPLDFRLIEHVVRAARDAGATSIWTNVLYLRPGTREHFMTYLARDWPELVPRYERLYRGRAYLGKAEIEPIRREVADLRDRFAVTELSRVLRSPGAVEGRSESGGLARKVAGRARAFPPGTASERPVQLDLESLEAAADRAARTGREDRSIVPAA